jgi:hypothetical protein
MLVMVSTNCGDLWLDSQELEIYVPGGYYGSYSVYSYSPNPADSELKIAFKENTQNTKNESKNKIKEFQVKLMDEKGRILREGSNLNANNIVTLNTSEVPSGTYFLHIKDDKELVRKQVIIQH